MNVRRLFQPYILVPVEKNDTFFIGTRVKFWHALSGIYLQVFSLFPHVLRLNPQSQLGVLYHPRLRMEGHSGT